MGAIQVGKRSDKLVAVEFTVYMYSNCSADVDAITRIHYVRLPARGASFMDSDLRGMRGLLRAMYPGSKVTCEMIYETREIRRELILPVELPSSFSTDDPAIVAQFGSGEGVTKLRADSGG